MKLDERVIDNRNKYSIFFCNNKALEVEKIKEIFSEFGEVINVRCTGDDKGYRFIEYNTYEEAKKAVDGLEDHPFINLKISKKHNHIKRSEQRNDENSDEKNNEDFNNKNKDLDWGNVDSTKTENSYSFSNEANKIATCIQATKRLREMSINSKNENKIGSDLKNLNLIQEDPLPNLVPLKKLNEKDNVKGIILENDQDLQAKKIKVLEAAEIIVGNINDQYTEAYFLFLFEKYEPLGISKFQAIPNSDILYCHIYFKTQEDAAEVERCFDNYDLNGRNLIVLRTKELLSLLK